MGARQSLLRPGLIGGTIGALLVVGAWRLFERQLLRHKPLATRPIPSCLRATPEPRYAKAVATARHQIRSMMQHRRIPGLSATVAIDGRVVWSEGFGFANVEDSVPVCPVTRFRIASVSKPMTAAAMMKLHEEGRLDLDAPVERYVPSFPPKGTAITARQLASHRAGIRQYRDDVEAATSGHYVDVVQSLDRFANDPLLFEPGTRHEYSSYGYVLLSAVMQGAAKQPFEQVMRSRVWEPLALRHTSLEHNEAAASNAAAPYDHVTPYVRDGQVHPSPPMDMSGKWASGGMISTTEDLARFGSALLPGAREPLLREETRATLFTTHARAPLPLFGYSLGWITARDVDLRRLYMHFGAGSGSTAWLGIFPDQRAVVAVLANLGHAAFTYEASIGIADYFVPTPWMPAAVVAAAAFIAFALGGVSVAPVVRYRRRADTATPTRESAVP